MISLVERLWQRITSLGTRRKALENQQHKDSHNSSKPPSSDGFKRRTKNLRNKSGRASGGQSGYPSSTLEWVEQVDGVEQHRVYQCLGCEASWQEVAVVEWELRQVYDLDLLRLKMIKCCPHCEKLNRGTFPADVNSIVQYGAGVKGLMVYLLEYQLLLFERVGQLLADVFNCKISEGTLYNSCERCFEQLAGVESQIREGRQHATVGNFEDIREQFPCSI